MTPQEQENRIEYFFRMLVGIGLVMFIVYILTSGWLPIVYEAMKGKM